MAKKASKRFPAVRWNAMMEAVAAVVECEMILARQDGRSPHISAMAIAKRAGRQKCFSGLRDQDLRSAIKVVLKVMDRSGPLLCYLDVAIPETLPADSSSDSSVDEIDVSLDLFTTNDLIGELARRIRASRSQERGDQIIRELSYEIQSRLTRRDQPPLAPTLTHRPLDDRHFVLNGEQRQ